MDILERPSPNFGERRTPISMLVLHYTGMETGEAAFARLCDPAAQVSAHYGVEEDGSILRLVPEDKRAWHAGVALWAGERDVNSASIGIEIVNGGHDFGLPPYPDVQIEAVITLCRDILSRHPIPARHIVGHSDIAPDRKTDPGEHFPWPRLAAAGIGLWPGEGNGDGHLLAKPGDQGDIVQDVQRHLAAIGYAIAVDGDFGPQTQAVLIAFQRRYRPQRLDGVLDGESADLIERVAVLTGP